MNILVRLAEFCRLSKIISVDYFSTGEDENSKIAYGIIP